MYGIPVYNTTCKTSAANTVAQCKMSTDKIFSYHCGIKIDTIHRVYVR